MNNLERKDILTILCIKGDSTIDATDSQAQKWNTEYCGRQFICAQMKWTHVFNKTNKIWYLNMNNPLSET